MAAEALCRRCARCCYEKLLLGDEVILTRIPCRHLDLRTRLCAVYPRRHAENVRCLTVEEGIRARAFPADCPYVQGRAGYRPPLEEGVDPALHALAEKLFAEQGAGREPIDREGTG